MANGHKVKFYLNAKDTQLLEAVVDVINRDPKLNFDLNSFAKDCVLRQGQMYLDQIRSIQQEMKEKQAEKQQAEQEEQEGVEKDVTPPETEQAGTPDANEPIPTV